MRVAFTIQHPAHVHFFKHAINDIKNRGHSVDVYVRGKDVNVELLNNYDIECDVLTENTSTTLDTIKNQIIYEAKMLYKCLRNPPDVFVSEAGLAAGHTSTLIGSKYIIYINNEHATLENSLSIPFADATYVPSCFRKQIDGAKQYNSYYVLSATHPEYFTPSREVLDDLNIDNDERYILLRTVAWSALHDVGKRGIKSVSRLIDELEDRGYRVLISSEGDIPSSIKESSIDIDPTDFHDLLYYADLYIGEGGATAAEAAVLGTPAIYTNSIQIGYLDEIEEKYDLVRKCDPEDLDGILSHLNDWILSNPPEYWIDRRNELLEDKEDMTEIIVNSILEYTDE